MNMNKFEEDINFFFVNRDPTLQELFSGGIDSIKLSEDNYFLIDVLWGEAKLRKIILNEISNIIDGLPFKEDGLKESCAILSQDTIVKSFGFIPLAAITAQKYELDMYIWKELENMFTGESSIYGANYKESIDTLIIINDIFAGGRAIKKSIDSFLFKSGLAVKNIHIISMLIKDREILKEQLEKIKDSANKIMKDCNPEKTDAINLNIEDHQIIHTS